MVVVVLIVYLGLFTWNQRTHHFDYISEQSGLSFVGSLFTPILWIKDEASSFYSQYIDLKDAKEDNLKLIKKIQQLEAELSHNVEERAELKRLQNLFAFKDQEAWVRVGTRILAVRFGPFSAQETVMIDKGSADGAVPNTPLITAEGVYGKVLRSAAHTSTVLLLSDPGFRVSVISQETRTPAILSGAGINKPLELHYVAQNAQLKEGELLITSGVAGGFPKGIPVAKVISVQPAGSTLFLSVLADAVVKTNKVEEALLIFPPSRNIPLGFLPPQDSSVEMEAEVHKMEYGDAPPSGSVENQEQNTE
nr:rod shape-determining protein MreC [Desulfovibrio litoralis]